MSHIVDIRCVLVPALLLATGGCVPIPHRHTEQAGAAFHVVDQVGRAVPGATVRTYAGSYGRGILEPTATVTTDASGRAAVHRERRWHMLFFLVPDAETASLFASCVEAPGFAPVLGPLHDGGRREVDVRLAPATIPAHCPGSVDRRKLDSDAQGATPPAPP